jgi:glycine cleavage system pyridoxal-binding protein P
LQGLPVEIEEIEYSNGVIDVEKLKSCLDDSVAAVVVQQPNFFGCVEDVQVIEALTHERNALLISVFNPASLGILPPPGSYNADVAVGKANRWELHRVSAGRASACSVAANNTRASRRVDLSERRQTSRDEVVLRSRCKRASSTSAAKKRPAIFARIRRCVLSLPRFT